MNENLKFCARLKCEYYIKNIKMMYNWSHIPEDDIYSYLDALGVAEYRDAIKWLLIRKSVLNVQINIAISSLPKYQRGTTEYINILNRLKVALVVCNKTQAVTILTSIAQYSSNPKDDIKYLTTF